MKVVSLVFLVAICLLNETRANEPVIKLPKLLAAMEKAVAPLLQSELDALVTVDAVQQHTPHPVLPVETRTWEEEVSLRFDETRWRTHTKARGISVYGGKTHKVVNDWLNVYPDSTNRALLAIELSDQNRDLELDMNDANEWSIGAAVKQSDENRRKFYRKAGVLAIVYGFLGGDNGLSLVEYLRDPKTKARIEPQFDLVDGKKTYVISSDGRCGERKIWVDAKTFLCLRLENIRKPHHVVNERPLKTVFGKDIPPGGMFPPLPLESSSTEISDVELHKVDGQNVLRRFVLTKRYAYPNNGIVRHRYSADIVRTDLNPRFSDASFDAGVPIPDGVPVALFDEIRTEWRGGKIVRVADGVAIVDLEDPEESR